MTSTSQTSGMPHVQVCLATYNGGRFLHEQIDSILAQTYPNLSILAHDDGSTDNTVAILDDYAQRFPDRVEVLPQGAPSGSAKANFARLLAASTAPWIACADQDDVWLPNKIADTAEALARMEQRHRKGTPLLVFTDVAVVDDQLQVSKPSFWAYQHIRPAKIFQFRRLLTQNVVTGSTMLMNRPLAELAGRMSAKAYMHDWWIALLVCALGQAEYLPQQTVLYRQHADNVLGASGHGGATGIPKWRYHEKRREQWESSAHQAQAMLAVYRDELPPRIRRLLEAYVRCEIAPSPLTRTLTLLRHGFLLQDFRNNMAILWYLWDMKFAKANDPKELPTSPGQSLGQSPKPGSGQSQQQSREPG